MASAQEAERFESVGTAHSYTKQELELLSSFESIEYLPPNNQVYREYLSSSRPPSVRLRWIAMGLIGFSVGAVGFWNKLLIEFIGSWRVDVLFASVLNTSVPEE